MEKARRIIVALAALLYLILVIKDGQLSPSSFLILMGIILFNQAIEEWKTYVETKNKFHLLIPLVTVIIIVFAIVRAI